MEYDDIKKVIQSSHINFLIGSGASKPFLDTLQGVEDALDKLDRKEGLLDDEIDKQILKYIEFSIKYHYFKKCIEKNLELLSDSHNSNQTMSAYKKLLNSLHIILAKRSSSIVSKQVNLFTTNMDIFLDVAVEKCGYIYNDGFSGRMNPKFGTENYHNIINKVSSYYEYQSSLPLFNIFKLHGSLNWKLNKVKNEIEYDSNLESIKALSEVEFKEEEIINCFDEKGNFLGLSEIYKKIKSEDFSKIKEKIEVFLKEYDNIIMVNPNKDKFEETTLKLSYYELLRMYSNNLEKENSVLFVTGFSFADEHIKSITQRVAKSNPSLLIIIFAFNADAQKEIQENMGDNKPSNLIYLTGKEEEYTLDAINEKYFAKLVKELFASPSIKEEVKSTENEESHGK